MDYCFICLDFCIAILSLESRCFFCPKSLAYLALATGKFEKFGDEHPNVIIYKTKCLNK